MNAKIKQEMFLKNNEMPAENQASQKQIYTQLLQLKFQLEEYIESKRFEKELNFGYFLYEYIKRQNKLDKEFAIEIGVNRAAISQYLNNHRRPTKEFIIRLELHANGMIPALTWIKLIQKEREYEIITDMGIRKEESRHVKYKLQFGYS